MVHKSHVLKDRKKYIEYIFFLKSLWGKKLMFKLLKLFNTEKKNWFGKEIRNFDPNLSRVHVVSKIAS